MPSNDDRIIFQHGEEQPISEKEFEQSQTPYEQTEMLIKRLVAWTAIAAKELEQYGYSCNNIKEKIVFAEEISGYEVTIYNYPGAIPHDAKAAERAACHVLKTAMALWEAIFTDNKPLIANLGLEFGLAVASAHVMPFEKLAITGKKSTDGYKKRTKSIYKETVQKWLKDNPDRVCHITKKIEIEAIPELKDYVYVVGQKALGDWFSEVYPKQIKGGRPKIPK